MAKRRFLITSIVVGVQVVIEFERPLHVVQRRKRDSVNFNAGIDVRGGGSGRDHGRSIPLHSSIHPGCFSSSVSQTIPHHHIRLLLVSIFAN